MTQGKTILITSGASGGHIFPALAVADDLKHQGHTCIFLLGGHKFDYLITGAGYQLETLPASAFNVSNPFRKLKAIFQLVRGFFVALRVIHKYQPSVVFGTGGYATVSAVLAAKISGVPTAIQEANVLPGRANKMLSKWVDRIALNFEESRAYLPRKKPVFFVCGNPVRQDIIHASRHMRSESGVFRLLILGGSQGARILSDVVPEMVARLSEEDQNKLEVVHQARAEDIERVQRAYATAHLAKLEVKPFIDDIGVSLVNAHLVISRAGAGSIVENNLIGRAAVYVPHQMADNHQLLNAQVAENAGAAIILEQPMFTPENLLAHVRALMHDKERLQEMEKCAKILAKPNATKDVAKLVLDLAMKDVLTMSDNKSG